MARSVPKVGDFTGCSGGRRHLAVLNQPETTVDLNYLLHRQQVERSRAESAPNEATRKAHEGLAQKYEERIEALTGRAFSFPTDQGSAGGSPVMQDER